MSGVPPAPGRPSPVPPPADPLPPVPVTRRFLFRGDSMAPLLEDGDEVWVRPARLETMAARELAVFGRFAGAQPQLIVHRVLPSGGTQGDSRRAPDPPLPSGEVLGRAVFFRRGPADRSAGRGVLVDLSSPRGARWSAFCAAYARIVLRGWWEAPIPPAAARPLRAAALALPRLLFRILH